MRGKDPSITAVVCTYNRSGYLAKATRSLLAQTLPHDQYEVLIVDNASTDDTAAMVRREFGSLEHLRYVREPVLGLSQARNTGWQQAASPFIAYLDDDAIASPGWLSAALAAFRQVHLPLGCVGGRVEALWEAERPAWLHDELLPVLAVLDWSSSPTVVTSLQRLVGANISYPKRVLEQVGGFSTRLGRVGSKLLSMEEVALRQEIEKSGLVCYYDPAMSVQHHIPKERLTRSYFRKRYYWQGVSDAIVAMAEKQPKSADPRTLNPIRVRSLPRAVADLLTGWNTENPEVFRRQCRLTWRLGFAAHVAGLAR